MNCIYIVVSFLVIYICTYIIVNNIMSTKLKLTLVPFMFFVCRELAGCVLHSTTAASLNCISINRERIFIIMNILYLLCKTVYILFLKMSFLSHRPCSCFEADRMQCNCTSRLFFRARGLSPGSKSSCHVALPRVSRAVVGYR